jgi:hypothetical protein
MPIRLSCPKSQEIFMGARLNPDTCQIVLAHLREAERVQEVNFRVKNTQRFKETYGCLSLPDPWERNLGAIRGRQHWTPLTHMYIYTFHTFHHYDYGVVEITQGFGHKGRRRQSARLSKKDLRMQMKRKGR